jgi:thioredoxin 1
MATEATTETFGDLTREGEVLVDFWGPNCAPCLALMPAVEELEARHPVKLVKVDATQNRQICRDLRVLGLPSYLLFKDGQEVERLIGDPTIDQIEGAVTRLLGGGD